MSTTKVTLTQSVIDYVRRHPGSKRSEIIEGIGYSGPPLTISNILARLRHMQVLDHRGGPPKHRQWEVVQNNTAPVFSEMASDILEELREVHHTVRVEVLARRLEELLGESVEEDD